MFVVLKVLCYRVCFTIHANNPVFWIMLAFFKTAIRLCKKLPQVQSYLRTLPSFYWTLLCSVVNCVWCVTCFMEGSAYHSNFLFHLVGITVTIQRTCSYFVYQSRYCLTSSQRHSCCRSSQWCSNPDTLFSVYNDVSSVTLNRQT